MKNISFSDLLGQTLRGVTGEVGGLSIIFTTVDGKTYQLYHDQSCCEIVTIDDICGELSDLVGSPITQAEENSSRNENPPGITSVVYYGSFTWTFYRIATAKGQVVIRWYGESNGYYSEDVYFRQL